MHDENVKRLQDWIALPWIAAENRNYPQGPDYMAQLSLAMQDSRTLKLCQHGASLGSSALSMLVRQPRLASILCTT